MIERTLEIGDHVQIRCAGLVVTGVVKSAYDEHVVDEGGVWIGNQAAGVEVTDENTGRYHYWKAVDGDGLGVVTKLEDNGERTVVFPRPISTGWTALEMRLTKAVYKRYFKEDYDKSGRRDRGKQLMHILDLVKIWFLRGGLFHHIDYHTALIAARDIPGTTERTYTQDIRSAYNNCIRGGQADL